MANWGMESERIPREKIKKLQLTLPREDDKRAEALGAVNQRKRI